MEDKRGRRETLKKLGERGQGICTEKKTRNEKSREVVSRRRTTVLLVTRRTGRVVPPFSPFGASEIGGFSDGVPTPGTFPPLPSPYPLPIRRRFVNQEVEERVGWDQIRRGGEGTKEEEETRYVTIKLRCVGERMWEK